MTLEWAFDPPHVLMGQNPKPRPHEDSAESTAGALSQSAPPTAFTFHYPKVGCGSTSSLPNQYSLLPNHILGVGTSPRCIVGLPWLGGDRIFGSPVHPESPHRTYICLWRIDSPPCASLS